MKIYTAGKIEIAYIPWDNWEFRKVGKSEIEREMLPKLKEMGNFRLPNANEINYICRELHEKLEIGKFYEGHYWYGLYKEMEEEKEEAFKRWGRSPSMYFPFRASFYYLDDSKRNFDRYTPDNMISWTTEGTVLAVRDI
jgi:hypothetical protein